jgi:hypothetical protein
LGPNRQTKRVQSDKAFGILLPIDIIFFKRGDVETV